MKNVSLTNRLKAIGMLEIAYVIVSLLTTELLYKFGRFTLELVGLIVTWATIRAIGSKVIPQNFKTRE